MESRPAMAKTNSITARRALSATLLLIGLAGSALAQNPSRNVDDVISNVLKAKNSNK